MIQTAGMIKSLCRNMSAPSVRCKKKECGKGTGNDSKTKGIGSLNAAHPFRLDPAHPRCGNTAREARNAWRRGCGMFALIAANYLKT
jgi:hypothetical protein